MQQPNLICISLLMLPLFSAATAAPQSPYFPPDSPAQYRADWYGKQLQALHEPSLWSLSKTPRVQCYRFLYLPTFQHPIAIRLKVNADGTSSLTTRISNGKGGDNAGLLIANKKSILSRDQTQRFLEKIEELKFWELPADDPPPGIDGAQWIVEGVKNGTYHMADRWSPESGPVRTIGLLMLQDLAKVEIDPKKIY